MAHAFTGCDTTSAIYMKGKNQLYKLMQKNPELRALAREFNRADVTRERLVECGEKLMLALYPMLERSRRWMKCDSSCSTKMRQKKKL